MAIMAFPIARHAPSTQGENFAGESFDADPRQDEKSSVVLVAPSEWTKMAERNWARVPIWSGSESRPLMTLIGGPQGAGERRTEQPHAHGAEKESQPGRAGN